VPHIKKMKLKVMEKLDFINGNKFSDIADFVIDNDNKDLSMKILMNNAIIYCKTDFLSKLFDFLKFSGRKYILISHMSDYPIDERLFNSKPPAIVKWYAENAVYDNSLLISIPIGLENHKGSSKGFFTKHEWLVKNIENLKNIPKDTSLYCNWSSINPNTKQEFRKNIREDLENAGNELLIESGLNYEEYCTSMAHHKFVVCPHGNGVDTHRLWEALYLGCYPITIKHRIYRDFNLPILEVEKWSNVNLNLLNEHSNKWDDITFHPQLEMEYWKNKIKS